MHACYVASVMSDSVTLWTAAHHAPNMADGLVGKESACNAGDTGT